MRYSEIIGDVYHHIRLPEPNQFWLDVYFSAAAHHLIRWREAQRDSNEEAFHNNLFRKHLHAMMNIIYISGNFREAVDPTGFELHKRESWNPERLTVGLPDPLMFNAMTGDERFGLGEHHISDSYLK
jgi:hypothetical protein